MAPRPFTTFGTGHDLQRAFASAEVPDTKTRVEALVVPPDENPSKVCTFIQKGVMDPATLADVPDTLLALVQAAAGRLRDDPELVLGIDMAGNAMGDKMRRRLSPDDESAIPFLLFGVASE